MFESKKKTTIKSSHNPSNTMSNSSENGKKFRNKLITNVFFLSSVQLHRSDEKKKSWRNSRESNNFCVKVQKYKVFFGNAQKKFN